MDCLFCKIIRGEIPNYTVYQDDAVLAFLDIHPCSKGHTVVIPKNHFGSLGEMNAEEWQRLLRGVKEAMKKIDEVLVPDGMNVGINERPAAGQAVGHAHWHIIPRWEGDGGGSMHSIVRGKESVDVKGVAELFK
ncbi:MAG: hypothetical protein A2754_03225 [Candidatus Magasanikbacteria bacterium RIFCSPHIGHO2_01_FULL_47_8]|uniref:HIT domain-containing protein n=1 Tax=Candidatus Magasanikbacteria bacterium RIFCSPHIGHO2_01_FULL_47_8 TaxID=1798673 RepID=A0A1F6MG65_9BACT|nr:MAG: hypothetical protein A2754_03225 [Candidatus Magasanikbacteria bacterium RIFCSPHIGHO2_01_FULL_47_8]